MTSESPFGRSAIEQAEFERHVYPATGVLRNKLNIKDPIELDKAERRFVAERARQGFPLQAQKLTYNGFKAIHRHLFQDVYVWAGKERTYTTGRGQAPFARPEFIASYMREQFRKLKAWNFLKGRRKDEFAHHAAELITEINAAHPFIDGNGRTQRSWLRLVSEHAGFQLVLMSEDRVRWNEASKIGFEQADTTPMQMLLTERLHVLK